VGSTSSTGSVLSQYTRMMRLTGLSTGLDTDSIVQSLMSVERQPYDKLYQKKQLLEWKQEAYREIISSLNTFKTNYFDYVKPANNLLPASTFNKYKSTSSNPDAVTVTGSANMSSTSHTIKVSQLATASKAVSIGTVQGSAIGASGIVIDSENNSINVMYDGETKVIKLNEGTYSTAEDFLIGSGIQSKLNSAFGDGAIQVKVVDGKLQFESTGVIKFMEVDGDSTLSAMGISNNAVSSGVSSDSSNKISLSDTMETVSSKLGGTGIIFDSDSITIQINGKDIVINKSDTLSTVISRINTSGAGVKISYSQFLDKFQIVSEKTGTVDMQLNSNGTNFFQALKLTSEDSATISNGQNAKFILDGMEAEREENIFTIDGVTYELKKADNTLTTITLEIDVDSIYNTIKSFVDDYNTLIDKLNTKIREKYDRDYQPLTESQREEMTEDEIKLWEEKAKTGILQNDSIISRILSDMRNAIYSAVKDAGITITDIGITTGSYNERGKLHIDETKLKTALKTNLDQVVKLFTSTSNATDAKEKYNAQGIAARFYDILNQNIGFVNGDKGTLLKLAGKVGDSTEYDNTLYEQIKSYKDKMTNLYQKLIEKEKYYYDMYSKLESYMTKMNIQSSWLSSQLGY